MLSLLLPMHKKRIGSRWTRWEHCCLLSAAVGLQTLASHESLTQDSEIFEMEEKLTTLHTNRRAEQNDSAACTAQQMLRLSMSADPVGCARQRVSCEPLDHLTLRI